MTAIRAHRLMVVAAVVEVLIGLAFYVIAQATDAVPHAKIGTWHPLGVAAFAGGGVLLFLLIRFPLPTWPRQGLFALAGLPLAAIAGHLILTRMWNEALTYGFLAAAVVLVPWIQPRESTTTAPTAIEPTAAAPAADLLALTVGSLEVVIGGLWISGALPPAPFTPWAPELSWPGVAAVVGGIALLMPDRRRGWARPQPMWRRLIGAVVPAALAVGFVFTRSWTGAVVWGVCALALLAPWDLAATLPSRMDPGKVTAPGQERLVRAARLLENWSWLQATAMVVLIAFSGLANLVAPVHLLVFVLAAGVFNLLLVFELPRFVGLAHRVWWHLVFLTLATGVLMIESGPAGQSLLVLLVILPPVATAGLGRAAGVRLLVLGALAVVVGGMAPALMGTRSIWPVVAESILKALLVVVGATLGMRQVEQTERLMQHLASSEARFANMLDLAGEAVVATDESQRIIVFNRAAEEMFEYKASEMQGRSLDILLPPDTRGAHQHHVRDFAAGAVTQRRVNERDRPLTGRRRSGQEFPAEVAISKLRLDGQWVFTAIVRDVSARRDIEMALRSAIDSLSTLVQASPLAIVAIDAAGDVTIWNRAAERTFGWTLEDVVGRQLPFGAAPAQDLAQLLQKAVRGEALSGGELQLTTRNGLLLDISISAAALHDASGTGSGMMLVLADITERKRTEAQVRHLANHDPLTDLCNRHRFHTELARELGRAVRYATQGALLFVDLDGFKLVNDRFGHPVGDAVLKQVADVIRSGLRNADLPARLGGDEFAVLLPHAGIEGALTVARRIVRNLQEADLSVAGERLPITCSIGIALYPTHAQTADQLLLRADQAMYVAKRSRNTVAVYRDDAAQAAQGDCPA